MREVTCPHCRSPLSASDFSSALRRLPESDRERVMRESTVRKNGALSPAGRFAEGEEGGPVFERERPRQTIDIEDL